ncbi:MAG: hypothetical protein AAFO03_10250 [Bacteroidota bacterium]
MNIAVLTPDREIFQGAITSVKVPGVSGEFQVLKNHAPIVSALEEGKVTIETGDGGYSYYDAASSVRKEGNTAGNKLVFEIEAGFIEVLNNEISLLVQGVTQL